VFLLRPRGAVKPPPAAEHSKGRQFRNDLHALAFKRRAPGKVAGQHCGEDSARSNITHVVAASRAFLRRLYHVERLTPAASHGCFAGRRGPMPCARRHRSERNPEYLGSLPLAQRPPT
jgi:hypothetical protein